MYMGKFEHFCQDFSTKKCEKNTNLFEGNNIISDQYEEEEETSLNLLRLSLRLR